MYTGGQFDEMNQSQQSVKSLKRNAQQFEEGQVAPEITP